MSEWLDIATIVKLKKSKGGFVVKAATGLPFLLQPDMRIHFVPPQIDAPRNAKVREVSGLDTDCATVHFDLPNDSNLDALVGCHCLVSLQVAKNTAESLNEELGMALMYDGFSGWSLEDELGNVVGTICDCVEHPTQLTLTLKLSSGEEKLIPLVDELLISIDDANKRIKMNLPAGILEV
ncbi:hypothetical protein [Adlercreutzia sp. ZJ154]|uniref:hypothetical protein n=1 Tax=Adlercreutzia sp. ZJ154 TaxID=2709790 RepID=UPI0013EE0BC3|nr:hypothetical protein [Adlercreutzia sp. ZJ154]